MNMSESLPSVAILGGTGNLGSGLAYQLVRKGYRVIVGSRTEEKGLKLAQEIGDRAGCKIEGMQNSAAAAAADVIILTVPFAHHHSTLESIRAEVQGKIFVDTTVPLVPPAVARVQLPAEGAVAKQAQDYLGENVRVVSAFQNIAADHLQEGDLHLDCDVLVCGNNPEAREVVVKMSGDIGLRAWHAGAIDNSVVAEALTSVLIFMNKRYKIDGAGIRITGEVNAA